VTGEKLFYEYDLSDISELNDDKSVQAQSLSTAWWLTPNQRLVAMGFEPDIENPSMNKIWLPMGLVPMDAAADTSDTTDIANEEKFYNERGIVY